MPQLTGLVGKEGMAVPTNPSLDMPGALSAGQEQGRGTALELKSLSLSFTGEYVQRRHFCAVLSLHLV